MFPASLTEKYKVNRKIGEGGMGVIYLATQKDLDRQVAIKLLDATGFTESDVLARFSDEARVCSKLNHKNIVQIYEFDVECSTPYMVLEYVKGETLKSFIEGNAQLSIKEILLICAQICDGLDHAHKLSVVHRDLKPDNIILSAEKEPRILDFGLAKMTGTTSVKTKTGIVVGTPLYMSPEQASGKRVDLASDMYSLGVMLFEMLSGTPPFDGESDMDILLKHLKSPPPVLTDFIEGVTPNLVKICSRLLLKDPAKRNLSASKTAQYLRQLSLDRGPWKPETMMITLAGREGELRQCAIGNRPVPPGAPSEPSSVGRSGLNSIGGQGRGKNKRSQGANSPTRASSLAPDFPGDLLEPNSEHAANPDSIFKSSSITKVSQFGVPGMKLKTSQGKRKLFAGIFALILALAVIFLALDPFAKSNQSTISSFRVYGGGRGALLLWTGNKKVTQPRFKILAVNNDGPDKELSTDFTLSVPSITDSTDRSGKSVYSHSMTVTGLQSNREYSISLKAGGDGPDTLPRLFSTRGLSPQKTVTLSQNGDLHIVHKSTTPFSCKVRSKNLRLSGDALDSEKSYYLTIDLVVPAKKVDDTNPLDYRISTIDGDRVAFSKTAQKQLEELFTSIYTLFLDGRKFTKKVGELSAPFFSMWSTKAKDNWLFNERANLYSKLNGTHERQKLAEGFWNEAEEKMSSECDWYHQLLPLLPGLPHLIKRKDLSWQFRQKIAFALIPLELTNGAASSYRLPVNRVWETCVGFGARPFALSHNSLLPVNSKEFAALPAFRMLRNQNMPIHVLQDIGVPKLYLKMKDSSLSSFLSKHSLDFVIDEDPSKYSKAEVVIDFRVLQNPSKLTLIKFNKSGFIATIRSTRKDFEAYNSSWSEKENYDGLFMMAFTGGGDAFSTTDDKNSSFIPDISGKMRSFKSSLTSLDEALPDGRDGTSIYHSVPVEVLQLGKNTITMTTYNGPTSTYEPVIYRGVRVKLSK